MEHIVKVKTTRIVKHVRDVQVGEYFRIVDEDFHPNTPLISIYTDGLRYHFVSLEAPRNTWSGDSGSTLLDRQVEILAPGSVITITVGG